MMRRVSYGVLLIALATLLLELMLTRVFDVVLSPNLGYFIVTVAVFAFGLAGIYATLKPISPDENISRYVTLRSLGFAVTVALLIPLINWLPLDYTRIGSHTTRTIFAFLTLYVALIVPFFLAGSVLIAIFSKHALSIRRLYFWDLVGAGIGSVIAVPFLATFGPGGLILWAAAAGLVAAALFTESRAARHSSIIGAVIVAALPVLILPRAVGFSQHMDKRGVMQALEEGRVSSPAGIRYRISTSLMRLGRRPYPLHGIPPVIARRSSTTAGTKAATSISSTATMPLCARSSTLTSHISTIISGR